MQVSLLKLVKRIGSMVRIAQAFGAGPIFIPPLPSPPEEKMEFDVLYFPSELYPVAQEDTKKHQVPLSSRSVKSKSSVRFNSVTKRPIKEGSAPIVAQHNNLKEAAVPKPVLPATSPPKLALIKQEDFEKPTRVEDPKQKTKIIAPLKLPKSTTANAQQPSLQAVEKEDREKTYLKANNRLFYSFKDMKSDPEFLKISDKINDKQIKPTESLKMKLDWNYTARDKQEQYVKDFGTRTFTKLLEKNREWNKTVSRNPVVIKR